MYEQIYKFEEAYKFAKVAKRILTYVLIRKID